MAEQARDTDLLFKALADPSRRKLLDLLHAHDGRTLNELCEHLDMTRQGVTQHLGVLEAANLVATVWRGREKLHFLNPVPLQEIYDRWISTFERSRVKAMRDLKRRLEGTNIAWIDVCLRDPHRHAAGDRQDRRRRLTTARARTTPPRLRSRTDPGTNAPQSAS